MILTQKNKHIDYAYNLRDNAERGRTASNRGGFQSLVFKVKGGFSKTFLLMFYQAYHHLKIMSMLNVILGLI